MFRICLIIDEIEEIKTEETYKIEYDTKENISRKKILANSLFPHYLPNNYTRNQF